MEGMAPMSKYAADTNVSVEASRNEIERTLARYKADAFAYATEAGRATIMFRMAGRQVRFVLALPARDDREFTHHSRGARTESAAESAWEQACRQRWRALALVIKAKLEAVSAGITTIEDEFLAHTILGDGRTVGEAIKPQIEQHYMTGGPANLMLEGPRK